MSAKQSVSPATSPVDASIVIVNYNAGEKLEKCLESLRNSPTANHEVVVIDNASTDGMAHIIEQRFQEVKLIRSNTNLEFGGGCNLGVRHSLGNFLVFLNPDTIVEPGWVDALLAPFKDSSETGLVTPKILIMNRPDYINACGCNIHITGITLCRGSGRSSTEFNEPKIVAAISGAAFAIRRGLFEKLGGFDENMFLYLEDTDLSWRAALAGWRTSYTPRCVIHHDYTLRMMPNKMFWLECNRYSMLLKSLKWKTLFLLIPTLLLGETVSWGFVLLKDRGNLLNKARAYRWLVRNWRLLMRERNAMQNMRARKDRDLLKLTTSFLDFSQTASAPVAFFAKLVFNPLFFLARSVTLTLVWW